MRLMALLAVLALGCRKVSDLDGDGFGAEEDCDDAVATVSPAAPELCNGVDDNCDGAVDVGAVDGSMFYADVDADGYGAGPVIEACTAPDGSAVDATDCDDANADVHPTAVEADCDDPVDYNCDGSVAYQDGDKDGFPACKDCDDADGDVNADATEVPYDGVDNDCDAATLEDDLDKDGFPAATDCKDDDAAVNTSAAEVPYDGVDNDCDATTLEDDLDQDGFVKSAECNDLVGTVNPGAAEVPYDGVDNDCLATTLDDDLDQDGFVKSAECNDALATVNPGATEAPYDGVDNDCAPATLDDDLDQDGFVKSAECNDALATVNPSVIEVPYDGVDNDCAPATRDDDLDQDGFIRAAECNDAVGTVNPSAAEVPYDGIDNDCAPTTLDDDLDRDGFIQAAECNDALAAVHPGAAEIDCADPVDYDCDGFAPTCAETCADTVLGGDESDVDCGGPCAPCDDLSTCNTGADCASAVCGATTGTCTPDACPDGVENGLETDKDCGGPDCASCVIDQGCGSDWDCASLNCDATSGTCKATDATAPLSFPGHYDCTDVAIAQVATASSSWSSTAAHAFDGNRGTGWNSGGFATRWVAVDLGSAQPVAGLTLLVNQAPNGATTHQVETATVAGVYSTARTLSGSTVNAQQLVVDFGASPVTARYVRITTTASPSWVAWMEIAVWTCP